jgi:phytoene dehydrogenase-like protein
MANYKTHLKGLYLTGASTHPGGGIMGASGRNAARVVLEDLEGKRL